MVDRLMAGGGAALIALAFGNARPVGAGTSPSPTRLHFLLRNEVI